MDNTSCIEVTQLSWSTQAGSAAKRRRVDTSWAVIRGILEAGDNTPMSLPWLVLLN